MKTRGQDHEGSELPPHSPETEQAVIGACLLEPAEVIPQVLERLTASGEAFYELRHREVWLAIEALHREGKAVDLMLVQQRLKDTGKLDQAGGLVALSEAMSACVSVAQTPAHIELLAEKWTLRKLQRECVLALQSIQQCTAPMQLVNEFHGTVATLADSGVRGGSQPIWEVFPNVIRQLESFRQGKKQYKGFSTGFNFLDNMLCGLGPAEYYIIAGRPGGGKTAVALQMAVHVAAELKVPVGFFSLEMNKDALASRIVFQQAGVNFQSYRNGFLREIDAAKLTQALAAFKRLPIQVDDTSGLTIDEIALRARRMVREHGVRLLVIDYLQLIPGRSGVRYRDMNERITDASDGLMRLKKELNIPIIVLAQENSNREKADRERTPMLSDLKDSQKPAQDADCVMFLVDVDLTRARRDLQSDDEVKVAIAEKKLAWMNSRAVASLPEEIRDDLDANCKRLDLFVCKQRNGPTGPAALVYVKPWMRFIDAHVDDAAVADVPMELPQ